METETWTAPESLGRARALHFSALSNTVQLECKWSCYHVMSVLHARWFTKHIFSLGYLESYSEESNTVWQQSDRERGTVRKNTKRADNEKNKVWSTAFLMLMEVSFWLQHTLDRAPSSWGRSACSKNRSRKDIDAKQRVGGGRRSR